MNTTSTHTATTHFDPPTSCLIFAAALVYLPSFSAAASSQERKKERKKENKQAIKIEVPVSTERGERIAQLPTQKPSSHKNKKG
jgi:hypothetical protein